MSRHIGALGAARAEGYEIGYQDGLQRALRIAADFTGQGVVIAELIRRAIQETEQNG